MFATPYPGSGIFDFAIKTGRIDKNRIHEFFMTLGDAREFTINLTDCFTDEELIEKRDYMMKKTRENYEKYITTEEIEIKMRRLYGELYNRFPIDEKDLEHRLKHGAVSIF
jgi:hypothetical protein